MSSEHQTTDGEQARAPASPLRTWLTVAVVLTLSLLATAGVKSYRDLDRVRAHQTDLEQRIAATQERIDALDERVERIQNDPLMLERLAREDLAMVRPGDLVIVLAPREGEERGTAEPQARERRSREPRS